MEIINRRENERKIIREKIYKATSEIIIEEGYDKVSIRKIASKIEYSPTLIYNYFKEKEDIIRAIISDNYTRVCESMLSLKLEALEPNIALRKGLICFVHFMIENPEHYKATMLNGLNSDVKINNNQEVMDLLLGIIKRGKNNGFFIEEDETIIASFLLTSISGIINEIVSKRLYQESRLEFVIEKHVAMIIRGVTLRT